MDIDEIRRKRAIKVIITDIIMTTAVIFVVGILVAAVAGWRINEDFTVEQKGLLSVRSIPENASVTIDGELLHQTTNTTRMLSEGKHTIKLEKEGYESWEKDFEITPGWLVKLEYPRLFKKNRESEVIKELKNIKSFYVSPDHTTAIYNTNDSTIFSVMTDFNSTPKTRDINISGVFSGTDNGIFPYSINYIGWSRNSERILLNVSNGQTNEWGIIDLRNTKESINLTTGQFKLANNSETWFDMHEISQVRFEDGSNSRVIASAKNNLVSIDLESKTVSDPVASNISNYFINGLDLIYLNNENIIELTRINEQKATKVADLSDNSAKISLALTRFNSMNYILYMVDNKLYVYNGSILPTGEDDISNMTLVNEVETGIIPNEVTVSRNGELVIFRNDTKVLVYDTEVEKWHEYDYGDRATRFLDDFILYRFESDSGKILAWDFDNTNYRTIVNNGGSKYDLIISNNNRYLYYINDNSELIREKL